MPELRAAVELGTHQWHVVALEPEGPRKRPIGQRYRYPTRKELQQALRSRDLVLDKKNHVRAAAGRKAAR